MSSNPRKGNIPSTVSAIVVLAVVMMLWGVISTAVGAFVDPHFLLFGLLQLSASIAVCFLGSKNGFSTIPSRVFVAVYLLGVLSICSVGAVASYKDAIPAAFFFGSIAALALGCLSSIVIQWNHFVIESDVDDHSRGVDGETDWKDNPFIEPKKK